MNRTSATWIIIASLVSLSLGFLIGANYGSTRQAEKEAADRRDKQAQDDRVHSAIQVGDQRLQQQADALVSRLSDLEKLNPQSWVIFKAQKPQNPLSMRFFARVATEYSGLEAYQRTHWIVEVSDLAGNSWGYGIIPRNMVADEDVAAHLDGGRKSPVFCDIKSREGIVIVTKFNKWGW